MNLQLRTHRIVALCVSILVIAIAAATLAFTTTNAGHGCRHAQGRLFNATEPGGPGRMIGTISGDYWYLVYEGDFRPDNAPAGVMFNWGFSRVEGKLGTIDFREFAAIDFDVQQGPNGAVLLYINDGTGEWEHASGHLALSGYFHTDQGTGVWDYQGEVCTP